MRGRKSLAVLVIVLVLAGAAAAAWYLWPESGPDPGETPDGAAMAFLEAMAKGYERDMADVSTDGVDQVLAEYAGEVAAIGQDCDAKVVGVVSDVLEQTDDMARIRATVTFECSGSGELRFLDAELELVRTESGWRVGSATQDGAGN